MKAIELGIINASGILKRNGRAVSDEKLVSEILKKDKTLSYSQAEALIEEWKKDLPLQIMTNVNEFIRKEVMESGILDNFVVIQSQGASLLHYKSYNGSLEYVDSLPIESKFLAHAFHKFEPEKFRELRIELAPCLRPKLYVTVDDAAIAAAILNACHFYTDRSKVEDLGEETIKPLTLNGKGAAYHSIDFKYNPNPILNPYLKDFLSRTRNHEHLCAILWLMFNGIKTPYLVYLYGAGGDGKSSFSNMLCKLVRRHSAFQKDGTHSFFHMFGKALITISENTDTFLLQHKNIKEITGGSIVACEEKNKTAFSAKITGLLLADSNVKPKLVGEEFEFRRMRYFETEPLPLGVEKISADRFTEELGKNSNDFISYCKQCYDKHGKNDMVENNDDMYNLTRTLVDSHTTYKYEKTVTAMKINFNKEKSLTVKEFYDMYYKANKNNPDRFYLDNFKTYLRVYHKVTEEGGVFKGVTNEQEEAF